MNIVITVKKKKCSINISVLEKKPNAILTPQDEEKYFLFQF